jgi:transposase
MKEYISFDSHKRYTLMEREKRETGQTVQRRVEHRPGAIRECLQGISAGTPVAVEAAGNWSWIVNEIEQAGLAPRLVHPRKAKLMMGMVDKVDKLDVHGLNLLQRNGTLPTVWIPPAPLRELRELTRGRMAISAHRTWLKNRIDAVLSRHGLVAPRCSDLFGRSGRAALVQLTEQLPPEAGMMVRMHLGALELAEGQLIQIERRLAERLTETEEMKRLQTLPGVRPILGAVIALEIGEVKRFPSAEHLASYAGTVPRAHASGDKIRHGSLRNDINHYLRWAFVEAANAVSIHHLRHPHRRVSRLYRRLRLHKGHAKAIGAVAQHLAEAAWHILNRKESYRDPAFKGGAARGAQARRPPRASSPPQTECDALLEQFHAPTRAKR